MKRATFRGVGLYANGEQLNRVTAFGATGTLSKEEVFELGNPDIVEIVEDAPEVSMTIDANEHGSLRTLALLAGQNPEANSPVEFNFSEAFEYASIPIWNYIKKDAESDTIFTQVMTGCVLTGYSANFSTDGNSTESFTLESDNKRWLLGEAKYAVSVKMDYAEGLWSIPSLSTVSGIKLISVSLNGRELSPNEYKLQGETDFTIEDSKAADTVVAVFTTKTPPESLKKFIARSGSEVGEIKRRGNIEICFFTPDDEEIKIHPAQSVSIDASLTREDILALGHKRFYDRPLSLPIDVTASLDIVFTDLELFAKLVGVDLSDTENENKVLSLDDFRNDFGLRVKIFDKSDLDRKKEDEPTKVLEIPQLIPSDEAWNISLDGQATQTFSFRGMELKVEGKFLDEN